VYLKTIDVLLTNSKGLKGEPDETERLSNGIKALLEARSHRRSDIAILIACLSVVVNMGWDIWQAKHATHPTDASPSQYEPRHTTNSPPK
jgi:hypothetical protein